MPLPENENADEDKKEKPSQLTLPETPAEDQRSGSSTPQDVSPRSPKPPESPARSQKSTRSEERSRRRSESKGDASDEGRRSSSKDGQDKASKGSKSSESSGMSRKGSRRRGSPGSRRRSVKGGESPGLKRQGSKKTDSPSTKVRGSKGSESPGTGHKRSRSQDSPKSEHSDSPRSPRRSGDGSRKFPDSPLRDSHQSKHEQLKQRHLGRRSLHETGHKQLSKQGSLMLSRKSSGGSEEEKSTQNELTTHQHHRSPKRSLSERRRPTRARTGSVYEHRRSSTIGGGTTFAGRRASVRIGDQRKGSIVIPINDRRLSIDHLSIADITTKTNGSTLHIEYPYKETVDNRPYMSPGLSSAYQKPGAEILIASLIIIVGLVSMITSFATGIRVWMVVGGVCMGLGGCFLTLGLCWHCARQRQKQEEEEREMTVLTSKQLIKLAERSPSTCSHKGVQMV